MIRLKKKLLNWRRNTILKKIDSVKDIVGATPTNKFKKIKHLKPMLSLSNAFDKDDIVDFIKKINTANINFKDKIFLRTKN